MRILKQSSKVNRHMAMLVIVLMILLPFAGLAAIVLIAALFGGSPPDDLREGIAVVGLLGSPAVLLTWGVRILSRIRDGFTRSTRRILFAFYSSLLAYCGFWMAVPWSHSGGTEFILFPPLLTLTLLLIIAIPAILTMITNHEEAAQGADGKPPEADQPPHELTPNMRLP